MKPVISRIKLHNFKRFRDFDIELDDKLNVIVGDNEVGKSSILLGAHLAMGASRSRVEEIGLEHIFNNEVIKEFLASEKKYEDLPILFVEIYLNQQQDADINGNFNSDNKICDGFKLTCRPNDDLSKETKDVLSQEEANFPYEFYHIEFKTFAGHTFTGYKKYIKHLLVDNSAINTEYATREYIRAIYNTEVKDLAEKTKHYNEYRKHKEVFKTNALKDINARLTDYQFAVKTSSRSNLETDLTILEQGISLDNRGRGRQVFIKTDFALKTDEDNLDVILIEEPENHLSHLHTRRLINRISAADDKQIIVTTHDDQISARLDLRKCSLIHHSSKKPLKLGGLSESTAEFFMKAPDNNILEFILSKKALLVEGDAEYILMESFYESTVSKKPEADNVRIIAINGTAFKRYLEVAKILGISVAVIRDNDGNYQANCVDRYLGLVSSNIKIFADTNNTRNTFEVALYGDNKTLCDSKFGASRRSLTVQEYMLAEKAEVAFQLLKSNVPKPVAPSYITSAIQWISEQ